MSFGSVQLAAIHKRRTIKRAIEWENCLNALLLHRIFTFILLFGTDLITEIKKNKILRLKWIYFSSLGAKKLCTHTRSDGGWGSERNEKGWLNNVVCACIRYNGWQFHGLLIRNLHLHWVFQTNQGFAFHFRTIDWHFFSESHISLGIVNTCSIYFVRHF